jgi:hypothetical protein
MNRKLDEIRHPETNRLMVEVSLEPGASWVRAFARNDHGRFWDAYTLPPSGALVVRPERSGYVPTDTLVCPAHGYLLAEAHLAPGETTIVVGYCRKCRVKYTMARIVTPTGDVIIAPTLMHDRQVRAAPGGALDEARSALSG